MLYLSSLLRSPKYRPAADRLFAALDAHGVRYGLLDNTRDIWLRDFMPVRRKDGKYVCFRYEPSYLKGYPNLRTDFKRDIRDQFWIFDPSFGKVIYSRINLDGGNVVFSPSREKVIISDRVFAENPKWERDELIRKLKLLLKAQVVIIPSLASDLTGHADGMVRFVDEDMVIGNVTPYKKGLEQRIMIRIDWRRRSCQNAGLYMSIRGFPYYTSSGISAAGCYINFLDTEQALFLPVFGADTDQEAVRMAEGVFDKTVVPVDIREIAADGGCLNCISWELDVKDTVDIPVVPCPACGGEVQALHGICPRCGWEYDGVTEDDEFSSANNTTLDAYRKQWNQRCGKGKRD